MLKRVALQLMVCYYCFSSNDVRRSLPKKQPYLLLTLVDKDILGEDDVVASAGYILVIMWPPQKRLSRQMLA